MGEGATVLHKGLFAAACMVLPIVWGVFMEWLCRTISEAVAGGHGRGNDGVDPQQPVEGTP